MARLAVREPLLEPSMPHKRPARKNRLCLTHFCHAERRFTGGLAMISDAVGLANPEGGL